MHGIGGDHRAAGDRPAAPRPRSTRPGANGLFYGGGLTQLGRQVLAILVTIAWSGGLTLAIAWVMRRTLGLRAAPEHEMVGIDEAEHAETGYDYGRLSPHMTGAHMASGPRTDPIPADRPAAPRTERRRSSGPAGLRPAEPRPYRPHRGNLGSMIQLAGRPGGVPLGGPVPAVDQVDVDAGQASARMVSVSIAS